MQSKVKPTGYFILILLVLGTATLACSSGSDADATAQAISEIFSKTATAEALKGANPENPLQTAQVEATQQAQNIEVTQEAITEANSEAQKATTEAAAPVLGELNLYGVDTDKGYVAWIHQPKTLEVDGYMAMDFANDHPETIVQDFVISADITWNTQYGSSGCGFMLRSNGNQNAIDQYMALITRGGSGHLIFAILENGEPVGGYDIFPRTKDKSFDWHNDTTNRVAVKGQGSLFTFYTNGTWVGEVNLTEPPPKPVYPASPVMPEDQTDLKALDEYKAALAEYDEMIAQINDNYNALLARNQTQSPIFEQGFVGMTVVSESGRTTCQFEDIWLWMIEE
jgi:hypothetical protein